MNARLEALSDPEKVKLVALLKRRLIFRAAMFSLAIAVSLGIMLFFNNYNSSYKTEGNIGIVNVVFVVVIVLCSRLLFADIQEYGKESRSHNKKIILTRLGGKAGNKIILGNKSFSRDEILLDNSEFDSLQKGDDVILELSAVSNLIFAVKKPSK